MRIRIINGQFAIMTNSKIIFMLAGKWNKLVRWVRHIAM